MTPPKRLKNHEEGKILQPDYDFIFSLEGEKSVCLTAAQIQWILATSDYAGWSTRWGSQIGTNIDRNLIAQFQGDLIFRLMMASEDCEGDMPFLLRQNPDNACQLQQSLNGGDTWTLAFDYALCFLNRETEVPLQRYEDTYRGHQTSFDGGVTWIDTPDNRFTDPITPNPWVGETDPRCLIVANIVAWMEQQLIIDDEQLLIDIIAALIQLLAVLLTGGAAAPLVIGLATAIINLGIEAFQAAMTEAEFDKFRENLYCHANVDGSFALEAYFEIIDQLAVDHTGLAYFFLFQNLTAMGFVGLNNAGHLQLVAEADCSEIDCDAECTEPFTPGTKVFSMDGIEGWTIEAGTLLSPGVIRGVYAPSPAAEVLAQLCFDEDFRVTNVSFQVQKLSSGIVPMKYEIQVFDSTDTIIAAHVFWDNGTGGFPWFTESITGWNKNNVRKFKLIGTKVPEGQNWEFRNITVVTEVNP